MRQKMQIDPKASSLDDFQKARQSPVPWHSWHKLSVLEGVLRRDDVGLDRSAYAAENNVSVRTLQRWIRQVNTGGLAGAMEPVQSGPERRRKVSLQEFRDYVVPASQRALRDTAQPDTVKNLYQSAQKLGLFDTSYATFRRMLRLTAGRYKRRIIKPTFEELMFHAKTGRWPARLKAYGRRRARKEKRATQRAFDEMANAAKERPPIQAAGS